MQPKTKKTLQIVTIVVLSLFVLSIISFGLIMYKPYEENYTDWRCFDHHLDYLDARFQVTKNSFELGNFTYRAYYRQIKGETENGFAATRIGRFFSTEGTFVIQDPENRISVIDDWTISSLGFYKEASKKGTLSSGSFSAKDTTDILLKTTDAAALNAISTIVTQETPADAPGENFGKYKQHFYIRLTFEESKNIVWNATVRQETNPESGERVFWLDVGKESAYADTEYCKTESYYVQIEKDSPIYALFADFVENYME